MFALFLFFSPVADALEQSNATQEFPVELPLQVDGPTGRWGPDRDADHATVAMNSRGDILVAYHADRHDFPGVNYPLKQVEAAIFRFHSHSRTWSLAQQELLGGVEQSPLYAIHPQDLVRCERPDVIAVGGDFAVFWTRRYDRSLPGQWREPAVLECAWLRWNGAGYTVETVGGPPGLGIVLDDAFDVRECGGVADAAVLRSGSGAGDAAVAVVYAHQTDFGDDPQSIPPRDGTRRADLRIATLVREPSGTFQIVAQPVPLIADAVYDGDPSPGGGPFPALYLPDIASGADPASLWLGFQEQEAPTSGGVPHGRVVLVHSRRDAGGWSVVAAQRFGDPQVPAWRHRMSLDSDPATASGQQRVSLAYVEMTTLGDPDVRFEEWKYDESSGLTQANWRSGNRFTNSLLPHDQPVVIHRDGLSRVRRCYATETGNINRIRRYDETDDTFTTLTAGQPEAQRPSVDLQHISVAGIDAVAVTWEGREPGSAKLRLYLGVDWL